MIIPEFVLQIIENHFPAGTDGNRIYMDHCRAVTELALIIARRHPELKANDEILICSGMLHDIGIYFTNEPAFGCYGELPYIAHGYKGRELLEKLGLKDIAPVCERHIGVGITAEDIKNNNLPIPVRDMMPKTIEENIICYADKFFSKSADNLSHPKPLHKIRKSISKYGEDKWKIFEKMMNDYGLDLVYGTESQ